LFVSSTRVAIHEQATKDHARAAEHRLHTAWPNISPSAARPVFPAGDTRATVQDMPLYCVAA
jgi:hypothetical protein